VLHQQQKLGDSDDVLVMQLALSVCRRLTMCTTETIQCDTPPAHPQLSLRTHIIATWAGVDVVKLGCQHVRCLQCKRGCKCKLSCLHTGRIHPYHHWDPGQVDRFGSNISTACIAAIEVAKSSLIAFAAVPSSRFLVSRGVIFLCHRRP
jgi:hypothetical protein